MGAFDFLMGSQDTTASAGAWPFLAGFGNNSFVTFQPKYQQPFGYNAAAFPGGTMPNSMSAPPMATVAPTSVMGAPTTTRSVMGAPTRSVMGAPTRSVMGSPTRSVMGAPTQSVTGIPPFMGAPPSMGTPPSTPTTNPYAGGSIPNMGGTSMENPSSWKGGAFDPANPTYTPTFRKDNTIFTTPTSGSWLPGLLPSAALQAAQGTQDYYPGFTVAPYSNAQMAANQSDIALGQDPRFADKMWQQFDKSAAIGGSRIMDRGAGLVNLATGAIRDYVNNGNNFASSFDRGGLDDFTGNYSENPYLSSVINNASNDALRIMNESLLPQDRAAAVSGGQYGGSRSGIAEGITRRGVGEEIAQQAFNTRFGDYNNFMNRKLQAGQSLSQADIQAQNAAANRANTELSGLTNLLSTGGNLYNSIGGLRLDSANQGANLIRDILATQAGQNQLIRNVGNLDQGLAQRFVDADVARWDFGQQAPWNNIQNWASIINGVTAPPNQTQQSSKPGLIDYGLAFTSALGGGSGIKDLFG